MYGISPKGEGHYITWISGTGIRMGE